MDDDFGTFLTFIAICVITIFFFTRGVHSAPVLDKPDDPFIVKKVVSTITVPEGYVKYYGKTQKSMSFQPKPLVLKQGLYNVGDTITLIKIK